MKVAFWTVLQHKMRNWTRLCFSGAHVVVAVSVDPALLVDDHVVVVHVERRGLVVVLHGHTHAAGVCLCRNPRVVRDLYAQGDLATITQPQLRVEGDSTLSEAMRVSNVLHKPDEISQLQDLFHTGAVPLA